MAYTTTKSTISVCPIIFISVTFLHAEEDDHELSWSEIHPMDAVREVDETTRQAVFCAACTLLGALGVVAALVLRRHAHPAMKAASASLLAVELGGCGLAVAAAAVASRGRESRGVCGAVPLLAHVGFVLAVLPACLRAWRLTRIFSNVGVVRIRTSVLLRVVAVATIAESVLHGARAVTAPLYRYREAAPGGDVAIVCRGTDEWFWTSLLFAPKAALLCWALALAYRTRFLVAREFNESTSIFGTVALVSTGTVLGTTMSSTLRLHRPRI